MLQTCKNYISIPSFLSPPHSQCKTPAGSLDSRWKEGLSQNPDDKLLTNRTSTSFDSVLIRRYNFGLVDFTPAKLIIISSFSVQFPTFASALCNSSLRVPGEITSGMLINVLVTSSTRAEILI
jgi:hypothetical protein